MVEKVRMCTWKVINFYSRIYGHFKCIDDSVARKKNSFLWLNSSSSFSSLQLLINMHAFCMQIAYLAGGVSVPHISQVYLHNGTYACDWAISGALRMTGEESNGFSWNKTEN